MQEDNHPNTVRYNVTALEMPIYFNTVRLDVKLTCAGDQTKKDKPTIVGGDHDHSGLMYTLTDNVPLLKYIRALINEDEESKEKWKAQAKDRADFLEMPFPQDRPQATHPPYSHLYCLNPRNRHMQRIPLQTRQRCRGQATGKSATPSSATTVKRAFITQWAGRMYCKSHNPHGPYSG